jgi:ABC-type transport system involved in multi-copper enzyme maturation permease subunit
MKSLIKIEWLKIKKYPVFWWMLGIVALTYPGVNFMFYKIFHFENSHMEKNEAMATNLLKMLIGDPFTFPEAWHSIAYLSSAFVMVPAILIVMLINNEYTYKTNRQNIIDGLNRKDFILAKLIDVALISLAISMPSNCRFILISNKTKSGINSFNCNRA